MAKARKPGVRMLTGDKELDAKLQRLKIGGANRIARKALGKALRIAAKSIKSKIPSQYKDAKRAIGSVMDARGGANKNEHRAKVGAAVGKSSKAANKKRKGGGVGIGGRNIHWFVLGTENRTHEDGTSTGAMPPIMPDIVKAGFAAASGQVQAVIRETVAAELAKEAKKK